MRVLTEAECRTAMEKGEFELPELCGPAGGENTQKTALILNQSWCPQWKAMKSYLPEAEKSLPDLNIIYIEYDQIPFFEEFIAFKENTYANREIPYVRYYINGKCRSWSNFVSLEGFLQRLQ
jgi:hypothetical protein